MILLSLVQFQLVMRPLYGYKKNFLLENTSIENDINRKDGVGNPVLHLVLFLQEFKAVKERLPRIDRDQSIHSATFVYSHKAGLVAPSPRKNASANELSEEWATIQDRSMITKEDFNVLVGSVRPPGRQLLIYYEPKR